MIIPKGYTLVPVVATMHMKNAGWRECERQGIEPEDIEMQTIWTAMHLESPTPPQPIYDEAKERELFEAFASIHYLLQELPLDFDDGEYIEPEVQYSWESWEARAKSVEVGDE